MREGFWELVSKDVAGGSSRPCPATGCPRRAPRVSVVVAAYNVAPYLREAVDSALQQTLTDLEVLVVDDGSWDGSADTLATVRDPRLQVLRHGHRGLAEARNAGIQDARGDFIAFLDGDDRWQPDKLAHHVAYLEAHPEVDLSFALHSHIDASGSPLGLPVRRSTGTLGFGDILVEPPAGNAVVRREVLLRTGLFDAKLTACEDVELWLRIAQVRDGNVALLPLVLDRNRRRSGQITADWRRMRRGWTEIRERARAMAPRTYHAVAARADGAWLVYLAFLAQERGDQTDALRLLAQSVRSHPASWLHHRRRALLLTACLAGVLVPERLHGALLARGVAIARRLAARR